MEDVRYEVCLDCYELVTFGILESCPEERQEEISAKLDAAIEAEGANAVIPGDSEDHKEFSLATCELCRSSFGGSRHSIVFLVPK